MFSRSHQLAMLEGGPTAVGNFSHHVTCAAILKKYFRDHVRMVHLGGYFSVPPGLDARALCTLCVKSLEVAILTPSRALSAVCLQGRRRCSYTRYGLARQHIRCKRCHRLDVQAASNCNGFRSHVGLFAAAHCHYVALSFTDVQRVNCGLQVERRGRAL